MACKGFTSSMRLQGVAAWVAHGILGHQGKTRERTRSTRGGRRGGKQSWRTEREPWNSCRQEEEKNLQNVRRSCNTSGDARSHPTQR